MAVAVSQEEFYQEMARALGEAVVRERILTSRIDRLEEALSVLQRERQQRENEPFAEGVEA